MSYSVAGAKNQLRILSLLFVGVIALSTGPVAHATDSTVNLAVCGSGAGAALTIDLPINDSVVDQSTVQVSGTVSNASQIDVSVDTQYFSTVPLNPGQTNYTFPVQLTTGTHTIALVANDVCQVQNAHASVIVTYQPQGNPSTGGSTPTQVGDNGAVINTEPAEPADDKKVGIEALPIIGPLAQFGKDMAVALDFEVKAQPGTLWHSMARFSFIVIGVATTVFGNIAVTAWGLTHASASVLGRWGIRAAGIFLLIGAFFI